MTRAQRLRRTVRFIFWAPFTVLASWAFLSALVHY